MPIGHLNAKVGREVVYKHIIGNESKHTDINNNGKRLIQFAENCQMKMSTSFKRKEIVM